MEDLEFPSETEKLQIKNINKQTINNSRIREQINNDSSLAEYRKGKSYDGKSAHNLKLESYDVNNTSEQKIGNGETVN